MTYLGSTKWRMTPIVGECLPSCQRTPASERALRASPLRPTLSFAALGARHDGGGRRARSGAAAVGRRAPRVPAHLGPATGPDPGRRAGGRACRRAGRRACHPRRAPRGPGRCGSRRRRRPSNPLSTRVCGRQPGQPQTYPPARRRCCRPPAALPGSPRVAGPAVQRQARRGAPTVPTARWPQRGSRPPARSPSRRRAPRYCPGRGPRHHGADALDVLDAQGGVSTPAPARTAVVPEPSPVQGPLLMAARPKGVRVAVAVVPTTIAPSTPAVAKKHQRSAGRQERRSDGRSRDGRRGSGTAAGAGPEHGHRSPAPRHSATQQDRRDHRDKHAKHDRRAKQDRPAKQAHRPTSTDPAQQRHHGRSTATARSRPATAGPAAADRAARPRRRATHGRPAGTARRTVGLPSPHPCPPCGTHPVRAGTVCSLGL